MENFQTKTLSVTRDGNDIYALVYLPASATAATRCPAVIFSHGMLGSHESALPYARELVKRGYAVCCFDFSGGVDSRSAGDALDMTLFSEQADLEAVYAALAKQPYIDANDIFLMGASMGGAVSALAAASLGGVIKGLLLLYPAFNLPDEVARRVADPFHIPDTAQFQTTVGRGFLETLYGFDIYKAAATYPGPVLIVHGTADSTVDATYSIRATKYYRHATLELIADAGHGFEGGSFKYAVRKIVDFLDEECDLADESGLDGDLNLPSGMGAFGGMGL